MKMKDIAQEAANEAERHRAVEPDDIVWLRDLDGTGSMHPCTPHDPGAIRYIREDLVVATWSDVA